MAALYLQVINVIVFIIIIVIFTIKRPSPSQSRKYTHRHGPYQVMENNRPKLVSLSSRLREPIALCDTAKVIV